MPGGRVISAYFRIYMQDNLQRKVNERVTTKHLTISRTHQYTLTVTMWTTSLFGLFCVPSPYHFRRWSAVDEKREETADRIARYQID